MKKIMAGIAKVMSFVFAAIVILYTSFLTWQVAQRLVPDNVVAQVMTVLLFDFAALIWFSVFLFGAKGLWQWVVAGLGFIGSLIGTVIMAGSELILGQNLVALENPEQLGWIVILTVIVACLVHVVLTYAYHLLDPETLNNIENMQIAAEHRQAAYNEARAHIPEDARMTAGVIRQHATRQILDDMLAGIPGQHQAGQKSLPPTQPRPAPIFTQPPQPSQNYAADTVLVTPVPGKNDGNAPKNPTHGGGAK